MVAGAEEAKTGFADLGLLQYLGLNLVPPVSSQSCWCLSRGEGLLMQLFTVIALVTGEQMREWIEIASLGIEGLAVAVIVGSVIFGSLRFLLHIARAAKDPYRVYKELIGNSLLLALEFLVAADVIRTVALDLTPRNVGMLGALVAIRTFLSWSVVVEMHGHWPWRSGVEPNSE
jgi:uncharacterized membrane protein